MPHRLVRFFRHALPHMLALVLFASVSALFFAPQYNGKALRQTDMIMFNGATSDIRQHIDRYDEHPQWAGRNFSGMPSYLIDMNYDGRWVKKTADRFYFLGQPAGWLFVAMAGFYLMLLLFGVDPWLSIAGGLGYGLSSYFVIIIGAGHITKMMALAWVAPMVGSVWYAYRRHRWLGASLAGLFAAVEISTSHPQITYYFLFVLLALVINEFIAAYKAKALARFGKTTAVLALAAVLALGANLVQLYYVAQHTPETTRGRSELTDPNPTDQANRTGGLDRDYITAWSYGKIETLDLLVPNLYGGGRDFQADGEVAQALRQYDVPRGFERNLPSYWGPQPSTEGPVYLGASLVFLALFGMFVLRGREKWWIAAVSLLAIFLAWGRHMMWFTDLFLDYLPMYNKFRTVSMILVIVEWAVPLLAILGLARLWNRDETDNARLQNGWKWSLLITGGLCLLIGLFGPMLSSFAGPNDESMGLPEPILAAMRDERATLMRADAFRSLLFVALTAGLVWLCARRKIRRSWFIAGLCGIILFDLFPVDKRYVSASDFRPRREALNIPTTDADRLILQDTTDYRVANFTLDPFTDATTSYHHRSVGGYHAAKLRRYQDLIERHLSRQNMAVYDMLNTKYFIVPDQEGRATVQQNPYACGSAWFVDTIRWVDTPDAEIAALSGFDPRTTAIVDRRFAPQLEGLTPEDLAADSTATITLTEYRTNRQTYRTRSSRDGLAVLSEIYYPKGWTAIIDGERAPYLRADYVLRAIRIPAGEHTLEFRFAAPNFDLLVKITRTCSAILLFGTLGLLVGTPLRKRHPQPTTPDTDGTPS